MIRYLDDVACLFSGSGFLLRDPYYFKAPDRLPFDKYRSTIKATTTKGATLTNAAADKLHHGVIDEFSATIATGKS